MPKPFRHRSGIRPDLFRDAIRRTRGALASASLACLLAGPGTAQETPTPGKTATESDSTELANATLNPVASLVSVPIQNNFDWGAGPAGDGFQYRVTVQPVIPISLNPNWNVISRTILPFVHQSDYIGTSTQTGLSDTVQSLFFSPKEPARGWYWGAGPVLQLPTATDDLLGEEKWGAGPTAVLLKQEGPWTYGALVNHVWSFAGEDNRAEVNRSFLQPFVSYTTKTSTSFSLNTESSYSWNASEWNVPLNAGVQQIVKLGRQPVAIALGGRYYADTPANGPEWGLRFQVSLLFPK